jgi:hypothetical protein
MKANDLLKRKSVILVGALLFVSGSALVARRWMRTEAPMVGVVAQQLTLPVLANSQGDTHITVPPGDRRILVLDMFETTCGPCKKSLPKAQHRFDAHGDVHFVAVCLDDDRARAEQVAGAWGLQKEVAWDENGDARKQFKVVGIPATVVIAPNGLVTGNFGYEPSDSEIARALDAARDAI